MAPPNVAVSTTPEKGAPAAEWDSWRPDFAAADAVVSNYNGETWPDRAERITFRVIADPDTSYNALEAGISARDGIRELQVMASYLTTRLGDHPRAQPP